MRGTREKEEEKDKKNGGFRIQLRGKIPRTSYQNGGSERRGGGGVMNKSKFGERHRVMGGKANDQIKTGQDAAEQEQCLCV